MPVHADGYLIAFTGAERDAMEIRTFGVRDGSHPTETRRRDENTMTRVFFVRWESRYDFCELVLGRSKTWDDAGTTKLSRLVPDSRFGRHPTLTQIVATRIEYIKGHGAGRDDANQFPEYTFRSSDCAEIGVFYEHAPWDIRSDAGLTSELTRYTSRSPTSTVDAEAFTLPGAVFKYVTAGGGAPHGVPVPFNISFTRPVQRFTMTWHQLPNSIYISGGALFERLFVGTAGDGIPFIGCVNKENIEFPGLGTYAAGQLLLEGVEDRRMVSPLAPSGLSGLEWDVGLKFAYTSRGWQSLFYFDPATPANSGYYQVTNTGTHYAANAIPDKAGLYNQRDMALLWNPEL